MKDRIQDREQRDWRRNMIGKSTLLRYQRIKSMLKRESFLRIPGWIVKRLVRLRGGVERLEVVRGRRSRCRREDRKCLVCKSGEVEDEDHFIDGCPALDEERMAMWRSIFDILRCPYKIRELREMTEEERVDWVLGTEFESGHWKWPALQRGVVKGLRTLWQARGRTGVVDAAR